MANIDDTSIRCTSYRSFKSGLGMEPNKLLMKVVTAADLDAAATSQTIDFDVQLPDKCHLLSVGFTLDTGFADSPLTATSFTLDIGDGTDADRFLNAIDMLEGGATADGTFDIADPTNPDGDAATDTYPLPLSTATTVRATFTADVNMDTIDVGQCTLYAWYFRPEKPTSK